jgi:hypothetical protein
MNVSNTFANILWLFHLLVILFVILRLLRKFQLYLYYILHFNLFINTLGANNTCSLTIIESYF